MRPTLIDARCVDGRIMRHDPQPDDPGLETDIGRCPECAGKGCVECEDCGCICTDDLCDDCVQNRAEIAWERHCEDFHDGGSTCFVSLLDQQNAARRLK